jgi:hypothetical protein
MAKTQLEFFRSFTDSLANPRSTYKSILTTVFFHAFIIAFISDGVNGNDDFREPMLPVSIHSNNVIGYNGVIYNEQSSSLAQPYQQLQQG